MRHVRTWMVGAILACASVGVTAVAIASQGDSPKPSASQEPQVLSAQSRAPSASDLLPTVLARGGFDVEGARLALATSSGIKVIATTRQAPKGLGAEGRLICAITIPAGFNESRQAGTSGCSTPEEFSRIGLLASGASDGNFRVTGLVPDGVASVAVTLSDGSTMIADVSDNAMALETSTSPVRAEFDGPRGGSSTDLSLPDIP